ncbi:MAG: hypothetical protein JEY97_06185 [Bacteroidales bacterium]|nr:hypothetical protein [Bacteroidales bacterium]
MEILYIIIAIILIGLIIRSYLKGVDGEQEEFDERINNYYISIIEKSDKFINENIINLAKQRKKTVFIDPYGKENTKKWFNKEIPYFIKNHILPNLSEKEALFFDTLAKNEVVKNIERKIKRTS